MKKRVSPTLIGAFVVGAIALAVGGIVLLGSLSLFSTVYKFVLYFDDSVDGLVIGAPVKFKGVQIGNVEQIMLAPTGEPNQPRIAVIIGLDETRIRSLGGRTAGFTAEQVTDAIKRGLRGTLASQSLLTGLLYVSLNYDASAPAPEMHPDHTGYPEIPTVPSRVEQVAQTANEIFKKLQSLDWDGLFDSISETMVGLRNLVADRETQDVTRQLNETMESIRALANRLDAKVDPLAKSVDDVAASVRTSLAKIDGTVVELKGMLQDDSPFNYDLARTMNELEAAARSIRELANSLDQNPSQVIFGRD
jgi:paraquat-inducible protein B